MIDKTAKKVFLTIFSVLLPLFLLLLAYNCVMLISNFDTNQQLVIDFLDKPTEFETQLLETSITQLEVSHLYDVSKVMINLKYFFYVALLILGMIITYYKSDLGYLQKIFTKGGVYTIIFPFFLLVFVLVAFDFIFIIFHLIFFPQGNWIFAADSFLITTFPNIFFFTIAIKIMVLTLIFGSIFILLGYIIKKRFIDKRK